MSPCLAHPSISTSTHIALSCPSFHPIPIPLALCIPATCSHPETSRHIPSGRVIADPPQCLGGMAHGPCGEQFKAAFSCFVFSEAEPKGVDCVELFKAMQDCFREHPDVYGEGECGCGLFAICTHTAPLYSNANSPLSSHLCDSPSTWRSHLKSQSHNCHPGLSLSLRCQAILLTRDL